MAALINSTAATLDLPRQTWHSNHRPFTLEEPWEGPPYNSELMAPPGSGKRGEEEKEKEEKEEEEDKGP